MKTLMSSVAMECAPDWYRDFNGDLYEDVAGIKQKILLGIWANV